MKTHIYSCGANPSEFTSGNVSAALNLYNGLKTLDNIDVELNAERLNVTEGNPLNEITGDIWHFHEMGNHTAELASKNTTVRAKVMTMHTTPYLDPDTFLDLGQQRHTIQNLMPFDVVIAPTRHEYHWVKDYMPNKTVALVPNGVNTDTFKPDYDKRVAFRKEHGYTDDDEVVLMVAHLQMRKGILDFIQLAGWDSSRKYLLVGKPLYREHPRNMQMINENIQHAPKNFKYLNGVEDIASAYQGADKYICCSYRDGCLLTTLEAAAVGLPILHRRIEYHEQMFPFVGHWFTHVAELPSLLDDDRTLRIAANASRLMMAQEYDYRVVAKMHVDIYSQILQLIDNQKLKPESTNIINDNNRQTAPTTESRQILDAEI
jgi:glycosyltransferase involved in cell wall biosynthesis